MNPTFEAVVGWEPRYKREAFIPAGVGVTRDPKARGRVIPDNPEMVAWLDESTPGWYSALKNNKRILLFQTSAHAALFKLFWS